MTRLLKILGDPIKKDVRRAGSTVDAINALEEEMEALSDEELRAKTQEFRDRLGVEGPDLSLGQPVTVSIAGDDEEEEEGAQEDRREIEMAERERDRLLEEILPEAFAVVREASRRQLGMRHFDVQLIGGMVLHQGKISEMRTGEGKTLVATLPLYLNALLGRGAHLVTVNDYLARRDAGWNGPLYHALGMSVGVIAHDMSLVYDPDYLDESHFDPRLQHFRPVGRREAYATDITYATNNELGFDYLRDNMAVTVEQCVQRRLWFAIVDEVDSILIDEARTPLIISGEANEPTEKYYTYARLIPRLVAEEDFTKDEKTKSAALTEEGIAKVEKWTGLTNVYDLEHAADAHQINQALRAHALYLRDREYIVKDGEVIIVDEFTGRTMPGRRWSDGLHQAIEAKEGVKVQQENVTLATITFQNFFRLYRKLAGMTGTALTEAEEFHKIYSLDVIPIPTNRPMVRKDESDLIYKTEEGKFKAVAEEIVERASKGQPVLVGTTSIEKSERLSHLLEKKGITHEVLNAKQHEREAAIVADAGKPGAVTIATNMAGRGTDIVLGAGVPDLGGLYIIGTERHESRRIDNQLRGRAGRQGDPGETRFFLSFEDDLMRVFGGDRMQGLMDRLRIDEDTPIESRMVTRQIEGAQSRVEGHNFDARRHVVEYDDVMNKQREVIYGERRKILEGTDTHSNLLSMMERLVKTETPTFCEGRNRESWDLEGLWERFRQIAPMAPVDEVDLDSLGDTVDDIGEALLNELTAMYEEKEAQYGEETMRYVEQRVMLEVIDQKWRAYLTQMDHLREGVGLVGYGQKDPLMEYKSQAFEAFGELSDEIQRDIVRLLMHVQIQLQPQQQAQIEGAGVEVEEVAADGASEDGVEAAAEEPTEAADSPPAARPAAAQASAGLARAAERARTTPGAAPAAAAADGGLRSVLAAAPTPPRVRNVVESSSEGTRAASGSPAEGNGGATSGHKVGRNEPCPCGSGLKYKRCHGRFE
ncbi:MAG TPA: preprotein translocase subunit SecA [Candidatus Dormibacteraeota bacterium]|nr:preprotein translocase subunit SecA [Candidatus Dormibacteraeota bacterium]